MQKIVDINNIPLVYTNECSTQMKVCYIVLTCEKYIPTRVKWQKETCFKNVPFNDCYFLSCKRSGENIYGWNTADDYPSCIIKYIKFFQNMDLDYDWYMFIDDDSFVFPNKVNQYLARFDKRIPLYIGAMWSHIENLRFMSGGAGFFLSKSTYKMLRTFLMNDVNASLREKQAPHNGDVSMGVWIREINILNNYCIQLYNDWKYLKIGHSNNLLEIINSVSFHYVTTENMFQLYNKYLDTTDNSIAAPKIISFPKIGSKVIISPLGTLGSALRHAYYKVSSDPSQPENDDFIFVIIPARNGAPDGFSFQSVNYPTYYLGPNNENKVFIQKIENNEDNESWQIIKNKEESSFQIISLSKRQLSMPMTVSSSGIGDIYLEKGGRGIQDFLILEMSIP